MQVSVDRCFCGPYRSNIAPAGRRRDLDVAEGKSVGKPSEADGSASVDLVLGGVERHLETVPLTQHNPATRGMQNSAGLNPCTTIQLRRPQPSPGRGSWRVPWALRQREAQTWRFLK